MKLIFACVLMVLISFAIPGIIVLLLSLLNITNPYVIFACICGYAMIFQYLGYSGTSEKIIEKISNKKEK